MHWVPLLALCNPRHHHGRKIATMGIRTDDPENRHLPTNMETRPVYGDQTVGSFIASVQQTRSQWTWRPCAPVFEAIVHLGTAAAEDALISHSMDFLRCLVCFVGAVPSFVGTFSCKSTFHAPSSFPCFWSGLAQWYPNRWQTTARRCLFRPWIVHQVSVPLDTTKCLHSTDSSGTLASSDDGDGV